MIPSHESTQQLHMAPLIESSQHYEVGTVTVPMVQMKKQEVTQPAQSPTENKWERSNQTQVAESPRAYSVMLSSREHPTMMALDLRLINSCPRNLAKGNTHWSQKFMYRDSHPSFISNGGDWQELGFTKRLSVGTRLSK